MPAFQPVSWFSEPSNGDLTNIAEVKARPKPRLQPRLDGRYCMSVNAILSTGQGCSGRGHELVTIFKSGGACGSCDTCLLMANFGPYIIRWLSLAWSSEAVFRSFQ